MPKVTKQVKRWGGKNQSKTNQNKDPPKTLFLKQIPFLYVLIWLHLRNQNLMTYTTHSPELLFTEVAGKELLALL